MSGGCLAHARDCHTVEPHAALRVVLGCLPHGDPNPRQSATQFSASSTEPLRDSMASFHKLRAGWSAGARYMAEHHVRGGRDACRWTHQGEERSTTKLRLGAVEVRQRERCKSHKRPHYAAGSVSSRHDRQTQTARSARSVTPPLTRRTTLSTTGSRRCLRAHIRSPRRSSDQADAGTTHACTCVRTCDLPLRHRREIRIGVGQSRYREASSGSRRESARAALLEEREREARRASR